MDLTVSLHSFRVYVLIFSPCFPERFDPLIHESLSRNSQYVSYDDEHAGWSVYTTRSAETGQEVGEDLDGQLDKY
jgi:hypothetical protein